MAAADAGGEFLRSPDNLLSGCLDRNFGRGTRSHRRCAHLHGCFLFAGDESARTRTTSCPGYPGSGYAAHCLLAGPKIRAVLPVVRRAAEPRPSRMACAGAGTRKIAALELPHLATADPRHRARTNRRGLATRRARFGPDGRFLHRPPRAAEGHDADADAWGARGGARRLLTRRKIVGVVRELHPLWRFGHGRSMLVRRTGGRCQAAAQRAVAVDRANRGGAGAEACAGAFPRAEVAGAVRGCGAAAGFVAGFGV